MLISKDGRQPQHVDVSVLEITALTGKSIKDGARDKLGVIPLCTVKSSVEISFFRVLVLFIYF